MSFINLTRNPTTLSRAQLIYFHGILKKKIQQYNQEIIIQEGDKKHILDRLELFNEVGFQTEILGQETL